MLNRKLRKLFQLFQTKRLTKFTVDQAPFMPGADMVSGILKSAGFKRISFERNDAEICVGKNLDEAVSFAMELGPAGEIIRLAGEN